MRLGSESNAAGDCPHHTTEFEFARAMTLARGAIVLSKGE